MIHLSAKTRNKIILSAFYLAVILTVVFDPFKNLELLTFDLRMRLRPTVPVSSDIVIITIDDETLTQLGQWPLPRDFHASLLSVLTRYGVKAVGFDIIFSEPSEYDLPFAESLQASKNAYVPLVFYLQHDTTSHSLSAPTPVLADITPVLKNATPAVTHINTFVDPDGKTRRLPLIIRDTEVPIRQMAFAIAQDHFSVPAPKSNELIINYPGTWDKSFQLISYIDLLQRYKAVMQGAAAESELNFLKDKVCFIGLTAAGTPDLRATPLESIYPMVGVHASVLNSFITGHHIQRIPKAVNAALTLIAFSLSLYISLRWKPLAAMLGAAALMFLITAHAYLLFIQGFWIDLFQPVFWLITAYTVCTIYRIFVEIKKRELLEQELGIAKQIQQSFLPKNIKTSGIAFSAFFQPAKFVAGDFYDVIPLTPAKTCVVVGDVAGKGVSAALIMAQAVSLFRIFVRKSDNPGQMLTELNQELFGHLSGRFITMLTLMLDHEKKTVTAVSAGHGPLYCFRAATGKIEETKLPAGVPLGLMPQTVYTSAEISLNPGDKILLMSDGVYEARDKSGAEMPMEKLKSTIEEHCRGAAPEAALNTFMAQFSQFTAGAEQHDDITFLILSLQSEGSSTIMAP